MENSVSLCGLFDILTGLLVDYSLHVSYGAILGTVFRSDQ